VLRKSSVLKVIGACAMAASITSAVSADPTLYLRRLPGPGVNVALSISGLSPTQTAGYQAFLEFDTTHLTFVSGEYVTSSMGLTLANPIMANGNRITVAAGINAFSGQQPTGADQDFAYLHFTSTGTGCEPRVRFYADAFPPTRLTDIQGVAIGPLALHGLWHTCPGDFNNSGSLTVQDIFDFLTAWFSGDCLADVNNNNGVSVQDIFDFLASWFGGC